MEKLLEVINLIRRNKQLAPLAAITPQTSLRGDLNFDSFDLAELTVRIEEEFGIDIFEDGLVSTIGEILAKLPDE